MSNWNPLPEEENKSLWDTANSKLGFAIGINGRATVAPPAPYKEYDISRFYGADTVTVLIEDLTEKLQEIFKNTTKENELLYALNWKGGGYAFDPRKPFEKDEFEEWLVPAFPNGDYTFFVTTDFMNGIFGDGITGKMTFFGEAVIEALQKNMPDLLKETKVLDFYKGFEGEPEISIIQKTNGGDPKLVLHLWIGFFNPIIELIEPDKNGTWVGVPLFYHTHTGWYEDETWECTFLDTFLVQLKQIPFNKLDAKTQSIHQLLVGIVEDSLVSGDQLFFKYF